MKFSDKELEEFWSTYIGDSGEIESSSITQIFVRGTFGGYSIREIMEYCVIRLNKPRPKVIVSENYN